MHLKTIDRDKFELRNCEDELTSFQYNGIDYQLKLGNLSEIGMSNYIYLDVRFYKGSKSVITGEMRSSEKYYSPISPNKKYIYIPFTDDSKLINLGIDESFKFSINGFCGNIYNKSSTKMILNGLEEFKVIDLLEMREILHVKEGKDYNNDAFFADENSIWQIRDNNEIEEINLVNNKKAIIPIKSPFDKFGIDKNRYQQLIDQKNHCLALPSGGLIYSGSLDAWNYVSTTEKLILETLIPTSEIKYSKGYQRDFCDVETKYVELKKNT